MRITRFCSASGYHDWQGFIPQNGYRFLDDASMPGFLPSPLVQKMEYTFCFASGNDDHYVICVFGFRRDGELLDEHPWISVWDKGSKQEVGSYWVDHGKWPNRNIRFSIPLLGELPPVEWVRREILRLPWEEEGSLDAVEDADRFQGFHQAYRKILAATVKKSSGG
jgi:hypothetical protein